MAKSENFFEEERREGTRVKLDVLDWYMVPWLAKVSSYAIKAGLRTVWYVDTFAGQGVYENGDVGSPVRAAERSKESIEAGSKIKLGIFAIEEDGENFEKLDTNLQHFRDDGVPLETKNGPWTSFTQEIANAVAGAPVLVFVDPFGLKGLEIDDMGPLLKSRATDVMFRLHDQSIHRNAPKNSTVVDTALGTTDWNQGWDRITDPDERIRIAHNAFEKRIRESLGESATVITHRVRTSYDQKPSFSLVFASKHPDGIDLFCERAAQHEIDLIDEYEKSKNILPGLILDQRNRAVQGHITEIMAAKKSIVGADLISLIRKGMIVKAAEVGNALKSLRDKGRLTSNARGNAWKKAVWELPDESTD